MRVSACLAFMPDSFSTWRVSLLCANTSSAPRSISASSSKTSVSSVGLVLSRHHFRNRVITWYHSGPFEYLWLAVAGLPLSCLLPCQVCLAHCLPCPVTLRLLPSGRLSVHP